MAADRSASAFAPVPVTEAQVRAAFDTAALAFVAPPEALARTLSGLLAQLMRFTQPVSLLGLPALALPVGLDSAGVPAAVRREGRPFAGAGVLRLGHACLQASDGHQRLPAA